MKLTTRSRYGTRMILDIALHDGQGPVRITDIARRQNLSIKYLEKLIRELKKSGLIKSKRGPNGGHMLTRDPSDITVGEIVHVLEGDPELVECGGEAKDCPRQDFCLTRKVWMDASKAMHETLCAVTIADLVKNVHETELPEGESHLFEV